MGESPAWSPEDGLTLGELPESRLPLHEAECVSDSACQTEREPRLEVERLEALELLARGEIHRDAVEAMVGVKTELVEAQRRELAELQGALLEGPETCFAIHVPRLIIEDVLSDGTNTTSASDGYDSGSGSDLDDFLLSEFNSSRNLYNGKRNARRFNNSFADTTYDASV
ncbi:hypothetical protein DIPPA_28162 [Diplonema papillatum]|nr:hypothetical protein DIPPA_28162 [Diplonema papillatum]